MSVGRRSMTGRIYQERPSIQKQISFNNPEQRKLIYPIKGDTSYDPSQYGKKHLSPKHSAIHSIIFNDKYNELMQEKDEIVKKLSSNKKTYERYQQNVNRVDNLKINDSIDNYLRKQQIYMKEPNVFQRSKSLHNEMNFQNIQKVQRGHLFRQNSINQILKPFIQPRQSPQKSQKSNLFSSRVVNNSGLFSPVKSNKIDLKEHEISTFKNDFPRYINPNNLNSIF